MIIQTIKEQLVQQKWYIIILEAFAAWYVFSTLKTIALRYRLKAYAAPPRSDHFFGFRNLYRILDERDKGNAPEFNRKRMDDFQIDTFAMRLAGKPVIVTGNPGSIKAMLATQFNDFALGTRSTCIHVTLGDGIFTLDGAGWKHSRAMLRPQFVKEQVGHVEALEPFVEKLIKIIQNKKGQAFDIQPLFFQFTVDSGTDFLFGESCDSLSESLEEIDPQLSHRDPSKLDPALRREFPRAFNYSQEMLNLRISLQDMYWLGTNKKFRQSNKIVHNFTQFYVDKALQASEKEIERLSRGGYVFLFELAKQTRDPVVLRDQCLNILLAARDTTSSLLAFLFYELARNPVIFHKLRTAIIESFGAGHDLSSLTFESLKQCEYLKWVLNETLRMYPSVPQNFRVATRDTTLPSGGGKDFTSPILVEKGTTVVYFIYNVHRNQRYYGKDANTFRPERWGDPSTLKLGWAFLPFNGGPRICLGQQFALTEAAYVTVRLLQTFGSIRSHDPGYPPRLKTHLTMSLMDGANISLF